MYEYEVRIGYSQVDEEKKLTVPGLINLFQDCSTFQSEDLGIGLDYCRDNKVFWVVNSYHTEIKKLPSLCDRVSVFTYPARFSGFIGERCFGLKEKDDIIVSCHSVWALLDTESFKPARMTEEMNEKYIPEEPLEMEKLPRKIKVPDGGNLGSAISVEPAFLDANHHVNNGKYVELAFSCLSRGKKIKRFRANYLAQAFLGDTIVPRITEGPAGEAIVSLENSEGSPYAVMEFV